MRTHTTLLTAALFLALLTALCLAALPSQAAILRPFTQITASSVRLADLFDDLGATPDRILGTAPAPGLRIVVAAPQLAAIARDFNVDWRPSSGAEQAVVERRGDVLSPASLGSTLRRALADAGAPADCDVASPDLQAITVPAGSHIEPEVTQLSYDAPSGHFSAVLSVAAPEMASVQTRVSGQVLPMVQTAVATRRLAPGSLVGEGDVQFARVRLASLHGGAALSPDAAFGLAAKHGLTAGQPVSAADFTRPPLVLKGAPVRMTLDSDGLSLTAQGIAAEAGARGERIRVENPVSHLLVEAEVTGAGEVRVQPRAAAITLASVR